MSQVETTEEFNQLVEDATLGAGGDDPVSLTIVSWGGGYTQSQIRAYHEPYMEMNPHVTIINEDGSFNALTALRAMDQVGNVTWDLVDMLPSDARLAYELGLILEIDVDDMLAPAPDGTPASEDFLPGSLDCGCFIPQIAYSTVLTFRPDAFPEDNQPSSIADLFDTENFPGRRALLDGPGTNLEWALYADGVDPDEIYDVLSTPEGVDRALAKLDTIRDDNLFWTEGAEALQLLADGEVAFAAVLNGRMFDAIEVEGVNAEIIWDGQVVEWDGWVIPAGGDNIDAVLDYLYFATDTQRLADQAQFISYGPARASSAELVGEHADLGIDMNPYMPTAPENYFAPIVLDYDFWADFGDELRERFTDFKQTAPTQDDTRPEDDPAPEVPESDGGGLEGLVTLSGRLVDVGGDALTGATVTFRPEGRSVELTRHTREDDVFGFELMPSDNGGRLEVSRPYDATVDGGPNASDALDVLRMAVGLEPSFGPATPEAFIAADMDGNGQIEATDALEVLRAAMGLATDNGPRWVFVDAAGDLEGVDRENVEYQTGVAVDALAVDLTELDMKGILLGDMSAFA